MEHPSSRLVVLGQERCVPPTLLSLVGHKAILMSDIEDAKVKLAGSRVPAKEQHSDDDIAVVGMACQVAGAEDVNELWDLMCRAESQHIEVPESRFTFETHWREVDPKRKWYGNFIRDHDAFDHRFFKKSPREASTQDPQQRLFLQSAYQAVEQSGYFNLPNPDPRVGVFVGVCANDYEANVACYQPNAFTATGNLKSFIAGKISHHFGWTGPGLTIDTACSASAVAIHQACRAILGGECTAALAGGTTIMTSPIWFQNLAGATFLSPTGACKPFDAKADGYCRGEAVASVFLKKMGQAVRDGDTIIGSIRSTAVFQNQNCTPIFVPNAPSLADLFRNVVEKARLQPSDISLVEAHGTGTPVGDPVEYESIRSVLGGRDVRTTPMPVGSIKGLIGHTECASGVLALIKVLLLLYRGSVPPQASFKTLSSGIKASPEDMMEINTTVRPWQGDFRAALINNYGASGSNASMVIAQPPNAKHTSAVTANASAAKQPFWFSAFDEKSLREYCGRLRTFIAAPNSFSLTDISYNLARQSNRSLPHNLIFQCESVDALDQKLADITKSNGIAVPRKPQRPVILCFGGQTSNYIGLDKTLFESHPLLRKHLNRCNSTLLSLGLDSIYPAIFEKVPIKDAIMLQTSLFALQYSCTRSWMDCGLHPEAVVGHSFGELTALCVSGLLSMRDTLHIIAARARLVKENWGTDSGAMMAIEGSPVVVEDLLATAATACSDQPPATIACFNGPRSFTLAGTKKAIAAVEVALAKFSDLRSKLLAVPNAFHSVLVEPLTSALATIAKDVSFSKGIIAWERATEHHLDADLTPEFFATHMRQPVYANHAFQRLHGRHPAAIWLEAGSSSTITNMASKALGAPSGSYFQAMSITNASASQNLLDTTLNLWKEGLNVQHWAHEASQAPLYRLVLLPPYQFEKSRHWLELKKPQKAVEQAAAAPTSQQELLPTCLYTFAGYQDEKNTIARFRINTMIEKYEELVSGHLIAQTAPICPATVEIDIVIEALFSIRPDFKANNSQPGIHNVSNLAPICIDPSRAVWLDTQTDDFRSWSWEINSSDSMGASHMVHVKGQIIFRSPNDPEAAGDLARYGRLVNHQRCLDVLQCPDPDDIIVGRNMYKIFSEIVDYSSQYQGLEKLVGKGNVSAGRIVKKRSGETWLDAHLSDCFSQVGGFWVNCMTDRSPADMYIAAGFETWVRATRGETEDDNNSVWDVTAVHHKVPDKASYISDIFIFKAKTGILSEVILGVHYARIPKATMKKTLLRMTPQRTGTAAPPSAATPNPLPTIAARSAPALPIPVTEPVEHTTKDLPLTVNDAGEAETAAYNVFRTVIDTLVELTGLEANVMGLDTKLADIGIDSLMGMEMVNELESALDCSLDMDRMAEATTIRDVTDACGAALDIEVSDSDDKPNGISTDSSAVASSDEGNQTDSATSVSSSDESVSDVELPCSVVLDSFNSAKLATDKFITDYGCAGYMDNINPKQTQLCVALILEAFEQLGCSIRTAKPGQVLERIPHAPKHGRLVTYLYEVLEVDGRLVDIKGSTITRTAVSASAKASEELVEKLVRDFPDHNFANRLTYFCGSRLVEVLGDRLDGVKLIFGTDEGRQLVSGLYGDSLLNKLSYKQMEDIIQRLVSSLPPNFGTLKILEMGAGTGGTTQYLVPLLASLNVPVEYTFTDLAPSFVAAARKKYKTYSFMKFCTHDIEKMPADDLIGTQHLIIASNAVHATHSLLQSLQHIRHALRPDGFLMMLEMTETVRWVDMIFGLLEGWWLFDDGRPHALSHQTHWEKELHAAGYGHVDWTDGQLPETRIQRLIIACASGEQHRRLEIEDEPSVETPDDEHTLRSRKSTVDRYVKEYTSTWLPPTSTDKLSSSSFGQCVLVTGATGSVGCHLVAHLARLDNVAQVVCLNRVNRGTPPEARQRQAFWDRGIDLHGAALAKLRILASDTAQPRLGLSDDDYAWVSSRTTHIIHNAWPMSGNRPVDRFEPQFQVMRNLIDLSTQSQISQKKLVTFQLISSIAVVGHMPLVTGKPDVPEVRVGIESVLPNGYGDAKYVCELMVDATLHRHPSLFRAMSVRLGQVAGSSQSGYWNTQEHLSFLVKSSQTLHALPDFPGRLSWTPVDVVASTLSDLALASPGTSDVSGPYSSPIFHIDNPIRQTWHSMLRDVWAPTLGLSENDIIPFDAWVAKVRHFPGSVEKDNPSFKLVEFLDGNFVRMSCGGLLLDTQKARAVSPTLEAAGPVSDEVARSYLTWWMDHGFLTR